MRSHWQVRTDMACDRSGGGVDVEPPRPWTVCNRRGTAHTCMCMYNRLEFRRMPYTPTFRGDRTGPPLLGNCDLRWKVPDHWL